MGKTTGIEWCNATWNPWQGCTKVTQGCQFCYMFREKTKYGQNPNFVIRSNPGTFNSPLRWSKNKEIPDDSLVFVCSWSDFFHKDADEWRGEALDIIGKLPQYKFLIPTKRIDHISICLPDINIGLLWPNLWLGVSISTNDDLWMVEKLLQIPAAVHFVSAEPLLSGIDFSKVIMPDGDHLGPSLFNHGCGAGIDWVICGGESGPNRRPMEIDWVRNLRDQCQTANVPFFLKQMDDENGKLVKMPFLDGRQWSELPEKR